MQSARVRGAFSSTVTRRTSPRGAEELRPAREQPLQDAWVGRPGLQEHGPWHLTRGVAEHERDHEHVVEWTDDRQELGDQIDG